MVDFYRYSIPGSANCDRFGSVGPISDTYQELFCWDHGDSDVISVKQMTLNEILVESGIDAVDFLSIDVDGRELEVLKGMSPWAPRYLMVEDVLSPYVLTTRIADYLTGVGYRKHTRHYEISRFNYLWVAPGVPMTMNGPR